MMPTSGERHGSAPKNRGLYEFLAGTDHDVEIRNMHDHDVAVAAASHGIRRLPAVVVDGRLADWYAGIGLDEDTLTREVLSGAQQRQTVGLAAVEQGGLIKLAPVKATLCPLCTECPEVVITDEGVTIGEDANTVRLSHAEWNELVRLIKRGELSEVLSDNF